MYQYYEISNGNSSILLLILIMIIDLTIDDSFFFAVHVAGLWGIFPFNINGSIDWKLD